MTIYFGYHITETLKRKKELTKFYQERIIFYRRQKNYYEADLAASADVRKLIEEDKIKQVGGTEWN